MVKIGTSGWQYRDWRGRYYPEKLKQADWLEYYCRHFRTVEVNNTFYRLPAPEVFAQWARRTPRDFEVVVKVSRYITHIKRLKESQESVAKFLEHARHLGSKLGPLLLQLPPNLQADLERLDETLDAFGPRVRVAVEFRHNSWFTDEVKELLDRHGAAFCLADRLSERLGPFWCTGGWAYLRFHEGTSSVRPCYDKRVLRRWAKDLRRELGPKGEIYVFFNNDPGACAIRDAVLFADLCRETGLETTRVPTFDDVTAGK